jgi:hypothetical protein
MIEEHVFLNVFWHQKQIGYTTLHGMPIRQLDVYVMSASVAHHVTCKNVPPVLIRFKAMAMKQVEIAQVVVYAIIALVYVDALPASTGRAV